MTEMVDASIIIPAYNAQEHIKTVLDSLLKETSNSFEIIVVNDGSTDDTAAVLATFNDSRLRVITQENMGVYAARNAALSVHRGRWVMFLDADDSVSPDFIANRLRIAEQSGADVVIFNALRSGGDITKARAVHTRQPYNTIISGTYWINHSVDCREWPHYLWLQTISSEFIRKHGLKFQTGRSHKDILWTAELATHGGSFLIRPEKDYIYHFNPASITNRNDYHDFRAISYIDVVSSFLELANRPENQTVKSALIRHSLNECRHFFGLYKRKVLDRKGLKEQFRKRISLLTIAQGIRTPRDLFFFLKLARQLLISI
ncbi:glycosyltransferase [Pantoea sp. FN0307]|uniref:glycosyltransferase n=1 Tax=unclassified Pantoea TaxID=2630326 RepID=UPI003CF6951D